MQPAGLISDVMRCYEMTSYAVPSSVASQERKLILFYCIRGMLDALVGMFLTSAFQSVFRCMFRGHI